jgi:hypothetical protein
MRKIHVYGIKNGSELYLEKNPENLMIALEKLNEAFKVVKEDERGQTNPKVKVIDYLFNKIFEKIEAIIIEKYQKKFEDILEFNLIPLTKDYYLLKDFPTYCEEILENAFFKYKKLCKLNPNFFNLLVEEISKDLDEQLNVYITSIQNQLKMAERFNNDKELDNEYDEEQLRILNNKNYLFSFDEVIWLYHQKLIVVAESGTYYRKFNDNLEILRVIPSQAERILEFLLNNTDNITYIKLASEYKVIPKEQDLPLLNKGQLNNFDSKNYELSFNDVVYLVNKNLIFKKNNQYMRIVGDRHYILNVKHTDAVQIFKFLQEVL